MPENLASHSFLLLTGRRTMCACPASIRWTAPELLNRPVAKEQLVPPSVERSNSTSEAGSKSDAVTVGRVITPACDAYSFAMVMWELPMCEDPFEEIATESEVCFSTKYSLFQE